MEQESGPVQSAPSTAQPTGGLHTTHGPACTTVHPAQWPHCHCCTDTTFYWPVFISSIRQTQGCSGRGGWAVKCLAANLQQVKVPA